MHKTSSVKLVIKEVIDKIFQSVNR